MREIPELRELMDKENWKGEELYGDLLKVYEGSEREFREDCGENSGIEKYCLGKVHDWIAERNSSDY
jgi:hypothetical protein